MADMDAEILIKILSAYESGGTEAAKKAMDELNSKTGDSEKATERAHGGWRAWMHTIHGTSQLAEGNIRGLGSALHGVSQLLGGMAGLGIGAVIGLGGAAIAGVIEHWSKAAAKIREAAQAAEDFKAKQRDATELRGMENQIKQVEKLRAAYDAAALGAENLAKAIEKNRAMNEGVELARFDAATQQALAGAGSAEERTSITRQRAEQRIALENTIEENKAKAEITDIDRKLAKNKADQGKVIEEGNKVAEIASGAAKRQEAAEATLRAAGIDPAAFRDEAARAKKISEMNAAAEKLGAPTQEYLGGVATGKFVESSPEQKAQAKALSDAATVLQHYGATVEAAAKAEAAFEAARAKVITELPKLQSEAGVLGVDRATAEGGLKLARTKGETATGKGRIDTAGAFSAQDMAAYKSELAAVKKQLAELEKTGIPEQGTHEGDKNLAGYEHNLEKALHGNKPADALALLDKMQSDHDAAVQKYIGLAGTKLRNMAAAMQKFSDEIARLETKVGTAAQDYSGGGG